MINEPLQTLNLTSISGITLATMFLVEIVKKQLGDTTWFKRVPVFVYAGLIAVILAFIANQVIKDDAGTPLLAGDFRNVIWAALQSALAASGLFTWVNNPERVQTASKADKGDVIVTPKLLIVSLMLLGFAGCQNPEKAILREGMDQGTRQIRKDHKAWAEKLTVDPATGKDHRDQLPKLSANDLKAVNTAHQQYEDLVSKDREGDK